MAPERKRKAPEELSTNVHTVKARKRMEAMDEVEAAIEIAKRNDTSAQTYAIKVLKKTKEYQEASAEKKAEMEANRKEEIAHRRIVDGKHWSIKARELGWGEHGGAYAKDDDGNPAWEDVDDMEEIEKESMWRADDNNNFGKVTNTPTLESGLKLQRELHQEMQEVEFRAWQRFWQRAFRSLQKKMSRLEWKGMRHIESLSPHVDVATGAFYDIIPPHKFFTDSEIAMWRNIAAWNSHSFTSYIELPGPAEFWPENYDFEGHGFAIPTTDHGHKAAFMLVFSIEREAQYELVFPSDSDLRLMDDTPEARFIRRSMQ